MNILLSSYFHLSQWGFHCAELYGTMFRNFIVYICLFAFNKFATVVWQILKHQFPVSKVAQSSSKSCSIKYNWRDPETDSVTYWNKLKICAYHCTACSKCFRPSLIKSAIFLVLAFHQPTLHLILTLCRWRLVFLLLPTMIGISTSCDDAVTKIVRCFGLKCQVNKYLAKLIETHIFVFRSFAKKFTKENKSKSYIKKSRSGNISFLW